MNKYKIYKVQNSEGRVVSNHDSYSALGNAKKAAGNCQWRLDVGSKIVEYEVTEVPVSEVEINLLIIQKESTDYRGQKQMHEIKSIAGYDMNKQKVKTIQDTSKISFNK